MKGDRTAIAPAESWLLEREHHLATLAGALDVVLTEHRGMLVLVGGEAGAGKTALVARFCAERRTERVLWGSCDPLFTPRPLAPMIDIAHDLGGGFESLVEAGAKAHVVAASLAREVQARRDTILVLEDMHWADEATLDVLSLLGRRIEAIPALVIVTHRDDELASGHPLRMLLGEFRSRSTRRLKVQPLSPDAVDRLAEPYDVDVEALYRATGGNPFYVTEVLASGDDEIPSSVRDAVLARAARLSGDARAVIEAVAIAPPHIEAWLLEALIDDVTEPLEHCLDSGILRAVSGGIAFRHELARLAIEESISAPRKVSLHRRALRALMEMPSADLARLAHHAEEAGDAEAVLRYAPDAGEQASEAGAHREAAAQFARALRFADVAPAAVRAGLLERLSYECYLTDQSEGSVSALEKAVECRREMGDTPGEGAALSSLSRRMWCAGRTEEAGKVAWQALHLLQALPPGRELALAYSNLGQLFMNAEDFDETVTWTTRALDLAAQIDEKTIIVHSLNTLGTMELLRGSPEGREKLERSLALAQDIGLEEHIGRAYLHIAWATTRIRDYEHASWFDRGIEVCDDLGLDRWGLYVKAYRARYDLDQGRWDAAADGAAFILRSWETAPLLRLLALTTLGLIRARRGDPGVWELLDEALAMTKGESELQYLAPVEAARAEAAWLEGRTTQIDATTRRTLETSVTHEAPWVIGEIAWLRRLGGIREEVTGASDPYALQLAGEGTRAAEHWMRLGCSYDAALALGDADADALRWALGEFQKLGARPAAAIVARRLRERGARGLPRGPRPDTLKNPANLTRREAEVLTLVAEGLGNAEIAGRLFLSEKTVHHHVSAILRKLDVGTRGQASAAAAKLGLLA